MNWPGSWQADWFAEWFGPTGTTTPAEISCTVSAVMAPLQAHAECEAQNTATTRRGATYGIDTRARIGCFVDVAIEPPAASGKAGIEIGGRGSVRFGSPSSRGAFTERASVSAALSAQPVSMLAVFVYAPPPSPVARIILGVTPRVEIDDDEVMALLCLLE